MGKAKDGSATPARAPASLQRQNSSAGPSSGQRTIQSFFGKKAASSTPTPTPSNGVLKANDTSNAVNAMAKPTLPVKKPAFRKPATKSMTPVPSSDAAGPSSSQENENGGIPEEVEDTGLPSPSTPAKRVQQAVNGNGLALGSSPSRKVRTINPRQLPVSDVVYRQRRLSVMPSRTMMMTRMPTTLLESIQKGEQSASPRSKRTRMKKMLSLEG